MALVVATCLPLLAGCGEEGVGGSSSTDAADQVRSGPCAILTTEDLEHATGLELTAQSVGTTTTAETEITCVWASDSPEATVRVWISPRADDYDDRRTAIHEAHGDAVDIEVPEADAAFVADSGSIVGLTGGDSYAEITFTYETDELADRTRQIAGLTAAKL